MKCISRIGLSLVLLLNFLHMNAEPVPRPQQPDYLNSVKITFLSWIKGFYLRPEIMYSHYNYDRRLDGARTLASMGVLLGTVGYQFLYKRFLADFWVGGGYAFGKAAETGYHHGFELWHWFGAYNPKMAMSFSIRLGLCF